MTSIPKLVAGSRISEWAALLIGVSAFIMTAGSNSAQGTVAPSGNGLGLESVTIRDVPHVK